MVDESSVQDHYAEQAVRTLLNYIEDDVDRPGLQDTPARVVRSWKELYGGNKVDIDSLFTVFEEGHDEMVVLESVEFYSTCEHHLLPFFGQAHVGYLPHGKIVGISKLARLVDAYARRLQVQERLGAQVVDTIMTALGAAGAGVVLEAKHLCMCSRGVSKQNSVMVTSHLRGVFRDDPTVRSEFLSLVRR